MLDDVERPVRIEPAPGQESVWDYPRPPRIEPSTEHVVVRLGGIVVADTRRSVRVLETSQAPAYYFPADDVDAAQLVVTDGGSICEWKGVAEYLDVVTGQHRAARAAWRYPHPTAPFRAVGGRVAFYPARVECEVDGEPVRAMPGGFYGGWITDRIVGPFKGAPGTGHW